jgi:diaminopimelate epimerase
MRELEFVKAHGLGNDFIIAECLQGEPGDADLPALSVRLCDRHFGIGADGLVLVLPSEVADYRMRIINSDGSEAEMCGNAIRCFASYLFARRMAGERMSIETLAGIKVIDVIHRNGSLSFTVNLGAPGLDAEQVPMVGFSGRVIARPLEIGGERFEITCVSVGNPHCVIFRDSVEDVPLEKWGPMIETHPAFPKKTNVEFAQILAPNEARIRVWERGAGVTLACGTGACATLVAGSLNGRMGREATVHLPGGDLFIEWRVDGNLYMTGPAQEVFKGTIEV